MNKKEMKINIQIFTGGFGEKAISFNAVKSKLDSIYRLFHIDSIIIGWSREKEIYRQLKSYLEGKNTKVFLWFPVFSELGYFRDFQPVIDFRGEKILGNEFQQGENFEFYCPTNKANLAGIKEIFEQEFNVIGFDGVFLDKIRYPSFANGSRAVFACFCSDCRRAMEEYGIDVSRVTGMIEDISEEHEMLRLGKTIPLKEYSGLAYEFENPLWKEFFEFKNFNIYRSLKDLYQYFRSKNLIVGLDTFAPFLGYFLGQDIKLLSTCGDFIKPMYYRKTWAPAGLPFETDLLLKLFSVGTGEKNSNISKITEGGEKTFSMDFVSTELKMLGELDGITPVYPGFEVNRKEGIAPVTPSYITENMQMFTKHGFRGLTLSWDIMDAPEDNLDAVYEFIQKYWR